MMRNKSRHGLALRFLLFSAVLQMAVLLFGTCGALEGLLPFYARAVSDKVSLGDDSYTEFFPIRQYMAETSVDLIVIGVDYSYAETYALLMDLIVSMKNDVNIGTVFLDAETGSMGLLSSLITSRNEESRQTTLQQLKERFHCNDAFCEFVLELSRMKDGYPPQRQYTGGTTIAGEDGDSRWQQIMDSAHVYQKRTGRPVLIVTDAQNLRVNAELRVLLRESADLSSMCMQCHYNNAEQSGGARQPEVKLLEQGKMELFDELYSDAAKKADGQYPDFRFSDIYTTEISFLLYNCTSTSVKEAEP